MCLSNGSGVSREVHAPFCEGLAGKFRRSTLRFGGDITCQLVDGDKIEFRLLFLILEKY